MINYKNLGPFLVQPPRRPDRLAAALRKIYLWEDILADILEGKDLCELF
jgi:hypothetical protein